ncbi:MAG: transglutaminase-like domain-containing protein [Planctomycetota bacterium]
MNRRLTELPFWAWWMLLLVAMLVLLSSTFGNWFPVGMLMAVWIAAISIRQSLRAPRATSGEGEHTTFGQKLLITLIAAIFASVGAIIARNQIAFDNANFIFLGVRAASFVCMALMLALWTVRPNRGHPLMLVLGLVVGLLSIVGGAVTSSIAAQTSSGILCTLAFLGASQITYQARKRDLIGAPQIANETSRTSNRTRVMIAISVALVMATGAAARGFNEAMPWIQEDLRQGLQSSIQQIEEGRLVGGMRYVEGDQIGTVREHMLSDPSAVALRIEGDIQPNYLRGHLYDYFDVGRGRWSTANPSYLRRFVPTRETLANRVIASTNRAELPANAVPPRGLRHFELDGGDFDQPVFATMKIVGSPIRGRTVFYPSTSRYIQAMGQEVVVNHHGQIERGIDTSSPYVAGLSRQTPNTDLSAAQSMATLYVAPAQASYLAPIARQIVTDASTNVEKAARVQSFFQENYVYSLDPFLWPEGDDPLEAFLKNRPPAHCEWFAMSTTLLLRMVGVPTRYAVGYVAEEYASERDAWVARNSDAHAWSEAYDDVAKRWFVVESTPGRTYATAQVVNANSEASADGSIDNDFAEDDTPGVISMFVNWLLAQRATDAIYSLFYYGQAVLLIGLILWFVRNRLSNRPQDEEERQAQKWLRQTEKKLQRLGLVRNRGETLHAFADRVDASALMPHNVGGVACPSDLAMWMRSFAANRYRGLSVTAPPR